MHTIQNISTIKDLVGLPKDTLKQICTNMNMSSDGTVNDLANRIWERIREKRDLQNEALEFVKNRILAGKTSITWYRTTTGDSLRGAKQLIIDNHGFNPFKHFVIPPIDDLTSEPVLIGAANGDTENEYYLRFIYKSGVIRDYYRDMISIPKTKICTIYINEENGIVEIRDEPKIAKQVASSLFALIRQSAFMEEHRVLAPFGYDVERLADRLDGEVIDTSSKPEYLLDDFTQEQAEAIVDILSALDEFFANEDIDILQDNLLRAQEVFGENLLETPFTAIILAGLQKVSMGSDRELRGQPLYDFLRPYLQHQSGFIRFTYPDNGVFQTYTIRVGLKANSIVFVSNATEEVINFVRERIIL